MPRSIESLVSFNAGEFSPTLTSRVDQAKYRSACLKLRNMLCLKTGPATRRPGTQFVAEAKNLPLGIEGVVRLQDFQFSVDTTFILEFGAFYVRFYSNGEQVVLDTAPGWVADTPYKRDDYVEDPTDGNAIWRCYSDVTSATSPSNDPNHWIKQSIYELFTPYAADIGVGGLASSIVFQLQFCQLNDVVYIVHPDYPRQKLTRHSDTSWTIAPVVDTVPALLDENATDATIAASATTGTTSLTASAPAWASTTFYAIGNAVLQSSVIYACVVEHTAGTFADDLAAGYWEAQEIFKAGHVGSYWELAHLRDAAYVEYLGTAAGGFAAGTSASITAFGSWELRTYGVWSADVAVQTSTDGGVTWQQVRQLTGRNDRNANIAGTAASAALFRIAVSNVAAPANPGATDPRIVFECVDAFLFGIVQITAVADATHATANVVTRLTVANAWVSGKQYFAGDRVGYAGINYVALNDVASADAPPADPTNWSADGYPTTFWSEGAWSEVRGYPRAITAFQQRVWCGFTAFEPQRVWGTMTGDLENWDLGDGSQATDAVAFDLDAVGDGSGLWLASQDVLFAGFVSSEWVVASSDSTQAIGPASVTAHRQSRWGSNKNVPARVVGDALVFVQRQAYSARQMLFSIATNKYMSADLTALSDQIFNGGAFQLAYQPQGQKNGFLWATTADGELVAMTYELEQEVYGWSRHTTGGGDDLFESVAVIPGSGGNDDEVWVVVARVVGGDTKRYVERLNPINWYRGGLNGELDKDKAYYVDSGVTYLDPSTNVFDGLDHLEGRVVSVCINAQDYGVATVRSGEITVAEFVPDSDVPTTAHVGLGFESLIQPMNLDVDAHTGNTRGIVKRISGITIALYETLACNFSTGVAGSERELVFREGSDPFEEPAPFTGDKDVRDFPGEYGLEIPLVLSTSRPLPMTVLSVAVRYNISGQP